MNLVDLVGKKDDPNYEQIRGHVPKALARQFKLFCLNMEFDYSEGVEHVIEAFFAAKLDQQAIESQTDDLSASEGE